jgi:hypothetical protein
MVRSTSNPSRAGLLFLGIVMGLAMATDLITLEANGFEKPAFMIAIAVTAMGLLLRLQSCVRQFSSWRMLTLTAILGVSGLVGVPFRDGGTLFYTVGDLGVVLAPAMIALFMSGWGQSTKAFFTPLFAVLLAGSALAWVLSGDAARFEAPPLILFAAVGVVAAISRARRTRVLAFVVLLVMVGLALQSGHRANLMLGLAVAALAIGVWYRLTVVKLVLLGPIAIGVLAAAMDSGIMQGTISRALSIESLSSSRVVQLGVGTNVDDASTAARVEEARDAIGEMVERANPLVWLFGNGHGATYQPRISFIHQNIGEDDRVHHIHVGPAMVLYRYGLLGLLLYVVLLGLSVMAAWRAYHFCLSARQKGYRWGDKEALHAMCALALFLYVVNSFTHNSFARLDFAVVLAGVIVLKARQSRSSVSSHVRRPESRPQQVQVTQA